MNVQIGERNNSFAGRIIARVNISFGASPLSSLDRRALLPVSFLSLCVLRSSNTGAYDSRMTRIATTSITPTAMTNTHMIQRQPAASDRKPPQIGAMIGPAILVSWFQEDRLAVLWSLRECQDDVIHLPSNGPIAQTDMARPL